MNDPAPLLPDDPLDVAALRIFLQRNAPGIGPVTGVERFPGGHTHLNYSVQTADGAYVLRRALPGAPAPGLAREFRMLGILHGHYPAPAPVLYNEDASVIGAPFFLMKHVEGVVFRPAVAATMALSPGFLRPLADSLIDNLVALHALDLRTLGLEQPGHPEGYVALQVADWAEQNRAVETDAPAFALADWLAAHLPSGAEPTLLHNDYKFDNLVLDRQKRTRVNGVLDWEMAAVGDPLMDVGILLAYWVEAGDSAIERMYNITWMDGQPSRREVADYYARQSGRYLPNIVFYYVFGLFRNAVLLRQMYARWQRGDRRDTRFEQLPPLIRALAERAERAIHTGRL